MTTATAATTTATAPTTDWSVGEFKSGLNLGSKSKVRGGSNPGSTQVRTLGLDQKGGRANINIKNLGSTQVQPRLNPGSIQVKSRFNRGSDPGSTQFEPTFKSGSIQAL